MTPLKSKKLHTIHMCLSLKCRCVLRYTIIRQKCKMCANRNDILPQAFHTNDCIGVELLMHFSEWHLCKYTLQLQCHHYGHWNCVEKNQKSSSRDYDSMMWDIRILAFDTIRWKWMEKTIFSLMMDIFKAKWMKKKNKFRWLEIIQMFHSFPSNFVVWKAQHFIHIDVCCPVALLFYANPVHLLRFYWNAKKSAVCNRVFKPM